MLSICHFAADGESLSFLSSFNITIQEGQICLLCLWVWYQRMDL